MAELLGKESPEDFSSPSTQNEDNQTQPLTTKRRKVSEQVSQAVAIDHMSKSREDIQLSDTPPCVLRSISKHLVDAITQECEDNSLPGQTQSTHIIKSRNPFMGQLYRSCLKSVDIHNLRVKLFHVSQNPPHLVSSRRRKLSRHLRIDLGIATIDFMEALAALDVSLVTLMVNTNIRRASEEERASFANSLGDVLWASRHELRVLHLRAPALKMEVDCEQLALALENLVALSISGMNVCKDLDLVALLSGPRERLRHLRLHNVTGITEDILIGIGGSCPDIAHIEFIDLTDAPSSPVRDLATFLGTSLLHYDYFLPPGKPQKNRPDKVPKKQTRFSARIPAVFANQFYTVMGNCPKLFHVSIDARAQGCMLRVLEGLALRSKTLRSLKIDLTGLGPNDVRQIVRAVPSLRELEASGLCNELTIIELCTQMGSRLRSFCCNCEIRPSDAVLCAIACCKELRELTLSSDESSCVSSDAVWKTFKQIGANLRMLTWDWNARWTNPAWPNVECTEDSMCGADLAKCIWNTCHNLELLEIQKMKPKNSLQPYYNVACAELRRRLPNTKVYLERSRPVLLGRTWSGEEIEY